jgi:hypothetical protein
MTTTTTIEVPTSCVALCTHGSGAVYFLHESLHGAGAPEAMQIQLRREVPLESFETAARAMLAE